MLNKRTHILFDQETFDLLVYLASQRHKSIGELVRKAVRKAYKKEFILQKKRKKIINEILSLDPVNIAPYKAADLIKEGRRFEDQHEDSSY